ncbi:PEST proteolytic signal-containing nuclear protein-like isoform X2 [Ptychodera flava]|uniref:PEST proteolytic signal-containing nuclear protein-like isoform X2 n=1 Tax=Ptychodera flava TaxID=63121 RepID=UPI003969D381
MNKLELFITPVRRVRVQQKMADADAGATKTIVAQDADPKTDTKDILLRAKRKSPLISEATSEKRLKGDSHTTKPVSTTNSGMTMKIGVQNPIEAKNTDSKIQMKPPAKAPISIKLGMQKPKEQSVQLVQKKGQIANVFGDDDSDEEPEEMPPEAKMRMRNVGRNTPTSAGPNSFFKTNQGFSNARGVLEKKLKAEQRGEDVK